jgi:hypothetical protein
MLDNLRIIRLDYPLDIVDTLLLASWIRDLIKLSVGGSDVWIYCRSDRLRPTE